MKKKFYRPILYKLLLLTRKCLNALPYRWGFSFGGTVGKLSFYLLSRERKKTIDHLESVFEKEKSKKEINLTARSVFENFGKMTAECCIIEKFIKNPESLVRHSGFEHLDRALALGKGIVIITAHFGNWEIMGGYAAMKGYPITVIAKKLYFEKYNEFILNLRKKMNVQVIYNREPPRSMLKVLKNNGILAFLADQDQDIAGGVFVDFFGRSAYTPTAPVRFAMATGAALIPAFIIREGMRHHIDTQPPIELTQLEDRNESVRLNTQKWASIQETFIRQHPHLWAWNHKRWKRQGF